MQVLKFTDYQTLSEYTAGEIAKAITLYPNLTLCMASGHTPALTCDLLVQKIKAEHINVSEITFLGLDEWVGLPKENTGSCHYFFQTKLIEPLSLNPQQYHLFDASAADLDLECQKMDAKIQEIGGIDIMLVGIGINGHIGFNEPNISWQNTSHVADLEDITKEVGQKYFDGNIALSQGITLGLLHLQNTKTVYLQANGLKKAEVIKSTVLGPVSEAFPASILQTIENGFVLVDSEAATLI